MEEENPDTRKDNGWTRGMQQAAKLEDVQHKYLWMDDGGMRRRRRGGKETERKIKSLRGLVRLIRRQLRMGRKERDEVEEDERGDETKERKCLQPQEQFTELLNLC